MIDPSRLSLKARLADKAAGRSDPEHLQPILYQQRVRELLDATESPALSSEVTVRAAQLTDLVSPAVAAPAYGPLSAPFVLDARDEQRGHWTSFGLGMASGVVCGWALLVIVVATVTSFGPQSTNAAVHPGKARPVEDLEHRGRDHAGAALPLATEYLTKVSNAGSARIPAKQRATGDFAVVPASVIAAIGGVAGEAGAASPALRSGAVSSEKPFGAKLQVVSKDQPADLGSVDQRNSDLSKPSGSRADKVSVAALPRAAEFTTQSRVKNAADGPTTRAAAKAVTPSRGDRKAALAKSRRSRVPRVSSKSRRRGKKLARKSPTNRSRSSAAWQRRAGRSSAGVLAVQPATVAKPPSFLFSAGLQKAPPAWAKQLFSTTRSEP